MPVSLDVSHPCLAAEWDDAHKLSSELSAGSHYSARWRCAVCLHRWNAPVYSRAISGNGCPGCSGYVPRLRKKDPLSVTHPALAVEWRDEIRRVDTVTAGSTYKPLWECSVCSHSWRASVNSRAHASKPVGCPSCSGRVPNSQNSLSLVRPDIAVELVDKKVLPLLTVMSNRSVEWECRLGSHRWFARVADRAMGKGCPECAAKTFVSRFENEVADFVRLHLEGVETTVRYLSGVTELDIYVPHLHVGIECNGAYWHSEQAGKGPNYHKKKRIAAAAAGVQLVQVWEDDWRFRRPVVERMLLHKLGVSRLPSVPARKTKAMVLTLAQVRAFFEQNHIQGHVNASWYFGLEDAQSGDIVAAMSLKRTADPKTLRLERYATSVRVPGGHSKLVKFAERMIPEWESLLTFADLEVSDGALYEKTGWTRDAELAPDYRYVVKGRRAHKFGYRLARFRSDPHLVFEENRTEQELAAINGLDRVWDSGKIRYRYRRSPS